MRLDLEEEDDERSGDDNHSSSLPYPSEIGGTVASQSPTAAFVAKAVSETSYATLFFRCITCCNCLFVVGLGGMVLYQMNQLQTLQWTVDRDQVTIAALQDEVRQKQENQIAELHQEVKQEHDLTFLTLAGIFTLLTCLISMFHMSSHLQKMNQPIIQRKIVAILWMSPIYSITSFLTLLYPPMEGYMAIIKDFYESYCIYTFLSFLIVVLGRGSRENAVEVLAMHAHHLEQPTRLLSRFYDPPPETSDVAKANAVITECQIFAMQFVFIRPLTTVIYVIYRAVADPDAEEAKASYNSYPASSSEYNNNTGNRLLRWLQEGVGDALGNNATDTTSIVETLFPTPSPVFSPTLAPGVDYVPQPTDSMSSIETMMPISGDQDFGEATKAYFTSFGFVLAMIVNISVLFAFTGLLKFYHSVHNDLAWCRPWPKFLTIKGVVFLTFWQGMAILIFVNLDGNGGPVDEDLNVDPTARGRRYQNILICCEMLFFSLTHWCVFPAEEWQKGYEPPEQVNQPGIGFQDFVSDVGQIYRRRRKGRRRRMLPGGKRISPRRSPDLNGLYHRPTTASQMSATAPTYEEEYEEDESSESNHHGDDGIMSFNHSSPRRSVVHHHASSASGFSTLAGTEEEEPYLPSSTDHDHDLKLSTIGGGESVPLGSPSVQRIDPHARPRFMSDGSSVKADEADDENDDMELI